MDFVKISLDTKIRKFKWDIGDLLSKKILKNKDHKRGNRKMQESEKNRADNKKKSQRAFKKRKERGDEKRGERRDERRDEKRSEKNRKRTLEKRNERKSQKALIKGKQKKVQNKSKRRLFSEKKIKQENNLLEGKTLTGKVKRHPDGFGFFIPDDSQMSSDVYIPRSEMHGVMGHDRIKILVKKRGKTDRFYGRIIEIVERTSKRVSGSIELVTSHNGVVHDHSHSWGEDLKVYDLPQDIKSHYWVSVDILHYPGSEEGFIGKIVAVIPNPLDAAMDIVRVLHTQSIPHEFSKQALQEAESFPQKVEAKGAEKREDLSHLNFVTIDGKTAKDFDDAIFVETHSKGFKVFVAIADVSHYVKPGSVLDQEAFQRGNSTYFPDFVVPMLPHRLSDDLCSLKPHKKRFALVFQAFVLFNGDVTQVRFFNAVIQSQARLTYGEAQDIVDEESSNGSHSEGDRGNVSGDICRMILEARDLVKILMKKRSQRGALALDLPETEIELDESGEPVDIIKTRRLFSHCMIEELMILANTEVAKFLAQNKKVFPYRVHEPPKWEDIQQLKFFFEAFGFPQKLISKINFKEKEKGIQKKINTALVYFEKEKKERAPILSLLVLRSMSQAKYDVKNAGHFGLSLGYYTHFTSPIRRFSDLIIHRMLKQCLSSSHFSSQLTDLHFKNMSSKAVALSAAEQRTLKAERQFLSIKKARFLLKHVGEIFEGMISSVKKFGIFVVLKDYDVDGLVKVEDLEGGYLDYDEMELKLYSFSHGISYSIGDNVRIQVAKVNVDDGKINFVLA